MTDLSIELELKDAGGRYVAVVEGHTAELTWVWEDEAHTRLRAEHTRVPKALSGRGLAKALTARLVADARAEGFRIVPQCSFVAAMAERHPDWADVMLPPPAASADATQEAQAEGQADAQADRS
ncbi:MAG: GNAT family N-acetyltransferase [Hyphomonadaceae bacterium]